MDHVSGHTQGAHHVYAAYVVLRRRIKIISFI
jgi:hypothetical protein